MQFPTVPDEWVPIPGCQYLDAAASTALTVPTLVSGQIPKGAVYVAVLTCQVVPAYIRTDGIAVTAAVSGGRQMQPGDFEVVYGIQALKNIRLIRSATGGSVAVEYYYFRPKSS